MFSISALAQDTQWLRLLHYESTLWGHKSLADEQSFFLHPDGKRSPEKELHQFIADLDIVETDPDRNVRCRFPARYRWYQKAHPEAQDILCPKLKVFRDRLAGRSVSVVFSSYYLNNPSSSFGHTFLRIGKSEETSELLDTGINYGAVTGDAGPVLYSIGGLAGWFPGTFNAIPYYYKVREYNDYETRDLWSYQLDLNQDEVDMVVDHLWELGHIYFDYFFLTENCSQMVLSILEAARPSLNLKKDLPYLYTIPSDTLKMLDREKLIKNVTMRPSPSSLFYHQLKFLSEDEQKQVLDLAQNKEVILNGPSEKQALIIDTAISFVDFKYAKEILKQEEEAQNLKRPLLVRRSRIPVRSPELDFSDKMGMAPHLGHGSQRLIIGATQLESHNYLDLSWRYAFHDFLDFDVAYPPRTRLEVGKIEMRTDGHDIQIQDVSFLDVMSLGKFDMFTHAPSWKVKLGHYETRHKANYLSTQGLKAGYGYAYHFKYAAPYILAHGEASYVSEEEFNGKFAYGADAGIIFDYSHNLKFHSVLELRAYPWNESNLVNEVRFSNKQYGLGLYGRSWLIDGTQEAGAKFLIYL